MENPTRENVFHFLYERYTTVKTVYDYFTPEEFYEAYPKQNEKVNGNDFSYRYYKNENATSTIVLLTGGIGLSDLLFLHFERFAKTFSVITFDYAICYPTMTTLTDAIAALLKAHGIKAWFVGQSLGGVVAQIIAKRHPEVVEGLVLSNTVGLMKSGASLEYYDAMKKRQSKSRRMIKIMPFAFFKKVMIKAIHKKTEKQNSS